ncbi:MAG: DUF4363 family protein [Thermacetogeniaceae bacterium]
MRKWSGWLLVLVIVAIITTGGILTQRYLDRSSEELASRLQQVQQAVEQRDWQRSESKYNDFEKRWNSVNNNWALFTDHLELDNLEMRLIRLQEFIETRDEVNARAEAGEALNLIKHIPERERLTWRNLF